MAYVKIEGIIKDEIEKLELEMEKNRIGYQKVFEALQVKQTSITYSQIRGMFDKNQKTIDFYVLEQVKLAVYDLLGRTRITNTYLCIQKLQAERDELLGNKASLENDIKTLDKDIETYNKRIEEAKEYLANEVGLTEKRENAVKMIKKCPNLLTEQILDILENEMGYDLTRDIDEPLIRQDVEDEDIEAKEGDNNEEE